MGRQNLYPLSELNALRVFKQHADNGRIDREFLDSFYGLCRTAGTGDHRHVRFTVKKHRQPVTYNRAIVNNQNFGCYNVSALAVSFMVHNIPVCYMTHFVISKYRTPMQKSLKNRLKTINPQAANKIVCSTALYCRIGSLWGAWVSCAFWPLPAYARTLLPALPTVKLGDDSINPIFVNQGSTCFCCQQKNLLVRRGISYVAIPVKNGILLAVSYPAGSPKRELRAERSLFIPISGPGN